MVATESNYSSDSELRIRAGRITYSLPARRLYRVAPYGDLEGTQVYAATLDAFSYGSLGVSAQKSYGIGEDVLYIESTAQGTAGLLYGAIIGSLAIGVGCTDKNLTDTKIQELTEEAIYDELESFGQRVQERYADILQLTSITGITGFGNDKTALDLPGDFTVTGKDTKIHADDVTLSMQAGRSGVVLNSVYGMLDAHADLYRMCTAGTFEQLYLINENFVHLKLLGLSTKECFTKGEKPIFRYAEEFSNFTYGKRSSALDDKGNEISSIAQSLDGTVAISGTRGVKLAKTIKFKKTLVPKNFPIRYNEAAYFDSKDKLNEVITSTDVWETPAEALVTASPLPPPSYSEGYTKAANHDSLSDGVDEGEKYIAEAEATIETLPSGGILIRDAWGSEIRMEGGNIQICAANNLTCIAGRDTLNICGGVMSNNVTKGFQLGVVDGPAEIQAATGVTAISESGPIRVVGDAFSIETSKINADVEFGRIKAGQLLLGGTRAVVSSSEFVVKAEALSLLGSSAGLILSSDAVLGAGSFLVNGNVAIRKGDMKINNIPDADGNKTKFTAPKSGCSLSVDGLIATTGSISASSHIVSADGVYAKSAAIKAKEVGMLKTAPKPVSLGSTPSINMTLHDVGNVVKNIIEEFEEIQSKTIFNLKSKAYTIWEPLCSKLSNMVKIIVALGSKRNYIYPGEEFWETGGMISNDPIYDKEYSPDQNYETVGASNLNLNANNAEESAK